jgi:hypothetical protein
MYQLFNTHYSGDKHHHTKGIIRIRKIIMIMVRRRRRINVRKVIKSHKRQIKTGRGEGMIFSVIICHCRICQD